jgi:hypothetical protein
LTHSRARLPLGLDRPSANTIAPASSSTWNVIAQPTPQYGQTDSTGRSSARGRSGTVSGLFVIAPVGQAATHSPHVTHDDSPIGSSRSKAMRVEAPLPVRPMTSLPCTSSQARTQRSQRMQAEWSTRIAGFEASCGRRLSVGSVAPAVPTSVVGRPSAPNATPEPDAPLPSTCTTGSEAPCSRP